MESSLTTSFYELANEVSDFLGYPSDLLRLNQSTLTTQQQQWVNTLHRVLKSGLRQFYFPPAVQGSDSPTDWSFLHPISTVDFSEGSRSVRLPDDFGGFEGEIRVQASNSTTVWWAVQLRNIGMIEAQYAQFPEMTSRPMAAALGPLKGTTYNRSSRTELAIFPQADQDYTLRFQYYILPDYLSGAFPYAYGGAAHAETLLESCLAIAEQKLDDATGVHTAKFQERLVASIGMDRKNKAQNLGYNMDRSDSMGRTGGAWWHYGDRILVNGQLYGP